MAIFSRRHRPLAGLIAHSDPDPTTKPQPPPGPDANDRPVQWEFVPDRRNLPPVLRSLIRQPVQQVWLDGNDLVFEGMRIRDAYPNRDPKGRQLFRQRRVRDRSLPVPLDEVIRVAVYPVRGGWVAGAGSARALCVAVDLYRVDDARTVATVDRRLGTEPEHEHALAEALRPVADDRWADEPADDAFGIDRKRLATWV